MKRFIKEILLKNWSLKATALLLSLILWLFVRGESGPERVVAIPLEVQLPRHMEIINERPTTVEVTMRGAVLSNMWFSQPLPNCIIDLQGNKEGDHVITLNPENVRVPKGSGIEVLQVNPTRVVIILQQTISKEVPIAVPTRGEPAHGFEIYGKLTKPPSVVITGPRSHIEPVAIAPTEPVSISGQKQPSRFFANLNLKDNFIRTSLSSPIQVDVQIGPRRRFFTIPKVPVSIDNPAYMTSPRQISIQVKAPVNMIESISPSDFKVTVDAKTPNGADLPIRVKPEIRFARNWNGLVSIEEVQPPEVTVRAKKPSATGRKK
jgi:YbbR domain-containing protein